MSHIKLIVALTIWTVAGITVVGCGDGTQSAQSAKVWPQNKDSKSEVPDYDDDLSTTYVTCRVTLTAIERDHRCIDGSDFGHDHCVSPLASFILVEPLPYTDRAMGIQFKYSGDDGTTPLPDEADIGRQFSVKIAKDFLQSKSNTIDNLRVRHFHKIDP